MKRQSSLRGALGVLARGGSAIVLVLTACSGGSTLPEVAPPSENRRQDPDRSGPPKLRMINQGPEAIEALVAISPRGEVDFGDLAVGAATPYLDVPGGVYASLAFRYRRGGRTFTQRIVDPDYSALPGRAYTFRLSSSQSAGPALVIQVVERIQDR